MHACMLYDRNYDSKCLGHLIHQAPWFSIGGSGCAGTSPGIRAAAPADGYRAARGGALEVVAEVVAKLVAADSIGHGVELAGLEPATPCMPCKCSPN
jgi:hypothetical protein